MCGIVGVIGRITKTERDVFKQLLIADSLRGSDSTGFVTAKGNDSTVFKAVGDPYMAMESRAFDAALLKSSNVLIGHNRYATTGRVNRKNAHPFDFDKVVGVHNGTLKNKHALKDGYTFDVDSEALYNSINLLGAEATIPLAEGAWSLVWWDKEKKEVSFLRNDQRPMFVALSEDKKTLFFASEAQMLHWILMRNGVKYGEVRATGVDQLYTLPVKEEFEGVATELGGFSVMPLKGKPEVFPVAPLVGVRPASGAGKDYAKVSAHLNSLISFYTDGLTEWHEGIPYVTGELATEREAVPCMVSVYGNEKLKESLLNEDWLTFVGYAISVRSVRGVPTLMLNPATVKPERGYETKGKKPSARILTLNKENEFKGYNGRPLTTVEWRGLTERGCSKCGDYPLPKDHSFLLWESEHSFLCKFCNH